MASIELVSILVMSLVFVFSGYAIEFETSGRLVIENFKQTGVRIGHFSGSFVVQCSQNKWAISYLPDGTATSEQTMYDGFDVYGITRNIVLDKQAVNQFPEPDKYVRYSNGVAYAKADTATIFSGEFPNGASFPQRFLWLVFLSGNNLTQSKTSQLPAPWLGSYMPEARCFEWKMQWPEMTSSFPQGVDFVVSRQLWTNALRDWETPQSTPQRITLPDGFVAARYHVLAWSPPQQSKVPLPTDFRLERYYASSQKILETYHGETTNFHFGSIEMDRPPIEADVNVLDYRFQSKELPRFYVVYPITDRKWKTTNDTEVTAVMDTYKSNYFLARSLPPHKKTTPSPDNGSRHHAVIICLLAITIAPGIVLLIKNRKKSRATTTD